MKALDRLRQHGSIPDAYSWATVALTVTEARELVEHVDHLVNLLALRDEVARGLRAELATATRRCSECGRSAKRLYPVHEDVDGVNQVTGWLGPGCWRKHLDALLGGGR